MKSPLTRFYELLKLERSDIISIYFYAFLYGLVNLSLPLGVQSIISFVQGAALVTSIYLLIILVVFGILIVGILQINQLRLTEKIQQKIFTRNAFAFTEKLPHIDLIESNRFYLPEKVNRFFDTITIQKGLTKLLLDIPTAIIQIVFGIFLLAFYNVSFIIYGIIVLIIIAGTLAFTYKKGIKSSIQESDDKYAFVAWLEEMAYSIRSFKFNKSTEFDLKRSDEKISNYLISRTKHFQVLINQYKGLVFFKVLTIALLLSIGVHLLITQKLNIGEFIAAEIVIFSIIDSIEKLIKNLDSVYDVLTGLDKLASITDTKDEINGTYDFHPKPDNSLELKNFSFAYKGEEDIHSGMNFHVKQGSLVVISGDEGSGKTTLLKILSTLYTEHGGTYLINKLPLNSYNLRSLRKQIGVYFTKSEIFTGTIHENIVIGKQISNDEVYRIAARLGFDDCLQNLPLGLDTYIDTTGKAMPKNINQKILILRSLIHSPSFLFMEQPWSGLEEKYREILIKYLCEERMNRITFVVSNDTELIQKCDVHIHLEEGKYNINYQ